MIPNQLKAMRFNRVRFGGKEAFEKNWQTNPYSYEEIQNYFPKDNYGVLCGKELRVLDDDSEDKILIKLFVDNFRMTFKVRGHLYFRFDNGEDKKIIFHDNGKHLGELQGEGTYVVGCGSTHPDGSLYERKNDLDIITISYEKFVEVFGKYINSPTIEKREVVKINSEDDDFIKAIKEKWVDGNRQDLAMSLAGYLRKNKRLGLKSALGIVEGIAIDCGDSEVSQRLACVRATYEKDEVDIRGISGLVNKGVEARNVRDEYLNLVKDKKYGQASEILVEWILRNNHIYTTKDDQKSEVWIYRDGIYAPHGKSEISVLLRNLLGNWYSKYIFGKVMEKIEPDTYIDQDKFFSQNFIDEIPVTNGILNIETRELREFSPDKIFFNKLPVEYNPQADCPKINKFLAEILAKEDDVNVFFEMGGYCFLKEYKFEKAFMLVGNGRNGKDKCLELVKRLIGIDNCCSIPLSSIMPDSFIISELHNKMVNLSGEISNQDLKETMTFKGLTGRSLQSAPRKFLKPVHFVNYAKFIFACNDLPMVYDNSKGFWDRWILLEFPFTFLPKEDIEKSKDKANLRVRDEDIIEKITSPVEMSGLLNRFLDGLDRLLKNRNFSVTRGSDEIKQLWIRKSNSCMAFCLSKIEGDYSSFVLKKEFRKKYSDFCKEHKIIARSDIVIKRTLEELFGVSEGRKMVNDQWEYVWEGARWLK